MNVTLSAIDGYATSAGLMSSRSGVRDTPVYAMIAATMPRSAQSIHAGKNVPKMLSEGQCITANYSVGDRIGDATNKPRCASLGVERYVGGGGGGADGHLQFSLVTISA